MLVDDIKGRLKKALKARNTVEKEILRVALGEIQTVEARTGEAFTDEQVVAVLRKLVKSNGETMSHCEDKEQREVLQQENDILGSLLPKTLDQDGIVAALADVVEAIKGAGNDGQATGIAMKHVKAAGLAVQGKDVAAAVKKLRG